MNIFQGSGGSQGGPSDPPKGDPERISEVQAVLDLVRPSLQADGGDVQLLAVEDDGVIELVLQGACSGCPSKTMTLRDAMEPFLRERISWMTGLKAD